MSEQEKPPEGTELVWMQISVTKKPDEVSDLARDNVRSAMAALTDPETVLPLLETEQTIYRIKKESEIYYPKLKDCNLVILPGTETGGVNRAYVVLYKNDKGEIKKYQVLQISLEIKSSGKEEAEYIRAMRAALKYFRESKQPADKPKQIVAATKSHATAVPAANRKERLRINHFQFPFAVHQPNQFDEPKSSAQKGHSAADIAKQEGRFMRLKQAYVLKKEYKAISECEQVEVIKPGTDEYARQTDNQVKELVLVKIVRPGFADNYILVPERILESV